MRLCNFTLTLVSFLFISSFAFSQKITGTTSTLADRKIDDVELVSIGDKVISIQKATKGRRGVGIDVVQYDQGMNEKKRVQLADEKTSYDELFMGIKKLHNKIYVITREDKKANNVIAVEVDPNTLALSAPKIIAATEEYSKKWMLGSFIKESPAFEFSKSADETTIGLVVPGKFNCLFISVMDENLKILWSKPIEITAYDKVHYEAFSVDNERNAYFGYTVGYNTKMEPKERGRYTVYTADGKESGHAIDLGQNNIWHMCFFPTKNNEVAITGSYHDEDALGNILGLFTARASSKNNFQLTNIVQHPFSEALLMRENQERWGTTAKKQYGMVRYFETKGFELEDGTIDIITEFHGYTETAHASWKVSGAIINFHFGKNDSTVTYIPKMRMGQSTIGDSYHAFPYKNKMIIFYIDNPDNLKNDPSARVYSSDNYSTSVLVAATVNENGTFDRKQAVSKEDQFVPMPELAFELSPNALMIPLQMVRGLGGIKEGLRFATIKIE